VKNVYQWFLTGGILAAALQSAVALAQPAAPTGSTIELPNMPSNLKVLAGNTPFLSGHAQGTQNYICLSVPGGFAWTFFSPQATLFFDFKLGHNEIHQQIITHFLSENPQEGGKPRATWQSSLDSSEVWAATAPDGVSTDSNFVAPGAIPWLKLQQVGTRRGPDGGDILANTTFVQRLRTSGGVAPATGCSQAGDVGAVALVPYSADYFFYKATGAK